METTEHFARVALVTELLGKQNLLSQRDVEKLVTARTHYAAGARAGAEERIDRAEEASNATERISLSRRELQTLIDEAIQQDRSRS